MEVSKQPRDVWAAAQPGAGTERGRTRSRPPGAGRPPHVTGSGSGGGGADQPRSRGRERAAGGAGPQALGPAGRQRPAATARVSAESRGLPGRGVRPGARGKRGWRAGGRGVVSEWVPGAGRARIGMTGGGGVACQIEDRCASVGGRVPKCARVWGLGPACRSLGSLVWML